MNKFFITFFLTFTLLILSNVESKGQCTDCPMGWFNYSFVYEVPGTDCEITVYYCTNCAPTGHVTVHICNIIVPYEDCEIQLNPGFWDGLKKAAILDALTKCDLLGAAGPCS